MYCPTCRMNSVPNCEVYRYTNTEFRCAIGHSFSYEALMMMKPDLIRTEVAEKAGPGDVKAEFFCNADVLQQFRAKFPNRLSATVTQIMRLYLDDDLVIIDGLQARELRSLKVSTGAEMLAVAKQASTLSDENEELRKKITFIQDLFAQKGVEMPTF